MLYPYSLLSAFCIRSSYFTRSGLSGMAQLVSRSDVTYSSLMSSELWPESLSDFKNAAVDWVWPPVSTTMFLAVGPSNLKYPSFLKRATPGMHRTEDRTRKAAMAPAHHGYPAATILNWKQDQMNHLDLTLKHQIYQNLLLFSIEKIHLFWMFFIIFIQISSN